MTALVRLTSVQDLFAPVDEASLAELFREHAAERETIERVSKIMRSPETAAVVSHFVQGNAVTDRYYGAEKLFELDGALASLGSKYWQRALDLTDVWDAMPQKRRDEWYETMTKFAAPPFEPVTVVTTLKALLGDRLNFFAQKVDGCFSALSGEHVTNRPEGFSKRMIFSGIHGGFYNDHRRLGYVLDLRAVVAKFLGRAPPSYRAVDQLVTYAHREACGQWVDVDGGAFRIRVYKKGTAHIEVHPDMAWKLNQVLAHLHPRAIPPKYRERPKKSPKQRHLFDRLIAVPVVEAISAMDQFAHDGCTRLRYRYNDEKQLDKATRREVSSVLAALGAVFEQGVFRFDYAASSVLSEVVASARVPDQRSYQYYPTPPAVRAHVLEQARICIAHLCLEPSAGQGHLATHLPVDRTTCVEISRLHCDVLRARGYFAVEADFLQWALEAERGALFDRVVMNPPFAEGQARAHVEAAARLVKAGGRLVAVLPVSLTCKIEFAGYAVTWSPPFANEFAGTGVSVVVMTAVRKA